MRQWTASGFHHYPFLGDSFVGAPLPRVFFQDAVVSLLVAVAGWTASNMAARLNPPTAASLGNEQRPVKADWKQDLSLLKKRQRSKLKARKPSLAGAVRLGGSSASAIVPCTAASTAGATIADGAPHRFLRPPLDDGHRMSGMSSRPAGSGPLLLAAAAGTSLKEQAPPARKRQRRVPRWTCSRCNHQCIPIRTESRCLCGHRLRHHDASNGFACKEGRCPCRQFFFIVAEGAWILRCSCKHKSIDHDPRPGAHKCQRAGCSCTGFASPWVCNCDHPWGDHVQDFVDPMELFKSPGFDPLQPAPELYKVFRGALDDPAVGAAAAAAGR